ncbi:MAG: sigma-70 family RNA polymerase sigma factor [Firmicutes bacterium]|nr:sigma-70 family RNA polymerase sigma factor [Bacillota bacterium]
MQKVTDEILAKAAQAGDIDAEETLLRKYKETVRMKARLYYIAGADEEDVVQEGMIGLFKAIHQYEPDRNAGFGTFAGLCITRQIISAIRSAGRLKHKILNDSISLNDPVGTGADAITVADTLSDGSSADPETLYLLKDIMEYISHNEDRLLSEFEMRVLTERMKGASLEDIANKLGRSNKSVDNAVRRAKKKIAEYISQ